MRLAIRRSYNVWLRLGVLALCFLLLGAEAAVQSGRHRQHHRHGNRSCRRRPDRGVKVTIIAVATNRQQTVLTDNEGRYSSGPLRAGEYRDGSRIAGLQTSGPPRSILLQVQQTAVVNLQMELGTVTQETTVTAAEELVRTVDASQGEVIEERRVKDLPLNGRDYLQLSLLSEGTLAPPGQGRTATGTNDGVGSRAGGFSAGGQRTTDNNYLLDGFDNNTDDTSFDTNQAEVIKPSVDAIQEFKVQTNAYSAEFGRAAGGVVNLTLKSGTNLFHGTAYDFLRNEKMDARNFFDPAKKPPFKRNDYGFTFGGPVKKDKLFFFFAWETLKRRESSTVNNTIPTVAMRSGDFSALTAPIYDPATYDGDHENPAGVPRQHHPRRSNRPDRETAHDFLSQAHRTATFRKTSFTIRPTRRTSAVSTRARIIRSRKNTSSPGSSTGRPTTYRRPPACRRPHSAAIRE